MVCCDRYDLALSTRSAPAAERYQAGVDQLLSLWPGAKAALTESIGHDPDFAMAHAALARLHAIHGELGVAREKIALASTLSEASGTLREQSHIHVLSLVIHGRSGEALSCALSHIEQWPRDVIVFGLLLGAFGLLAFSGQADHDQARVDVCERYARQFPHDDWWFLTYRGWSHGENGNIGLGRELTQRSLELRRENANAAHAVCHVLFEAGEHLEVGNLISQWLPGYDPRGILHGHIAWHAALAELAQGNIDSALRIYSNQVSPRVSCGVPLNVISDSASFLWRLQVYGHSVPMNHYHDAAEYAADYFQQAGFAFADVHMALLAAATGDGPALEGRAEALDLLVRQAKLPAGPVVPTLCRAFQSFAQGRYFECAQAIEAVAHDVPRIGGSGAQREIIEDIFLAALMHAGETTRALALLGQRLHRRPSLRDMRWQAQLQPAV